ncbi:hypothetical protein CRUP_037428 [Coryphaenoides rupestris]|nr:hypothetical protein CRUP_037428 [Coryphaenoides rupestris]
MSSVHVRRTDKVGTEAAFHPIDEYMSHVDEQFQLLARRMHVDKKRVYLATDDPSLLQEAKTKASDGFDLSPQRRTGEAHDKDIQVVELPIVDSLHPRPPYLPLAIPEDLALRLHRLHGDPSVWWVSQFVKYLVRPQGWLEKEIQQTTEKLGFKHPIIG